MTSFKGKLDNKSIIFITISIAIVLMSAIYLYNINLTTIPNKCEAVSGTFDLRSWDMEGNIDLDGEWEFYPNVLIDPNEGKFEDYRDIKKYVNVPGAWESYLNEDRSTDGSGTYRLKIILLKEDNYGIKTRTIRVSSHVFINGNDVINMGRPSLDRSSFIPDSKYKIGFIGSDNNELELVIHISSYGYSSGGIIKPIEFGTSQSIIKRDRLDRWFDGLIISVCLVLSFYFFLIYFQRRKETYLIYFSGTSLFMGLYLSTMNEQLLDLFIDYDYLTRIRIQLFSMIMVTICFLFFVYYFFKEYRNEKRMKSVIGLMCINLLLILNNPAQTPSIPQGVVQLLIMTSILISYTYIIYTLTKAILHKAESSGYALIIAATLTTYWLTLALKIFFELDLGYLSVVLLLIMMITVALLMSYKLQLDYQKADSLSKRLVVYDKLKDEFLARASHELRTPLHVMLNLTQSLIEGKKGTLNSKQQEDLYFINKEGKRLTRLVEDLLDASQLNKGEIKLRIRAVESHKIVEEILDEMRLMIPSGKDLKLINEIPNSFPKLKSDPDKFTQIIYNLVYNAIKYTDSGEIRVSAYQKEGQAFFEVKDTGSGIEEENIGQIFDAFYQKNGNDNNGGGLGLGLTIVKQLVEVQGGKIDVKSVYGKGSCFSFSLPLSNDESETEIQDDFKYSIKSIEEKVSLKKDLYKNDNKYSILIVDDEVSNQKVMADIILEMGFNIIFADNGNEALQVLKRDKVDLVVLDFMLPDMSGAEVCGRIREKYAISELPILVLTASGRNVDLLDAFEYGANDFLKKPADADELRSRILSLLSMKTSVEEGINKELQYFYSQISPHFLYNTINTIIGLSYKDTEQTRAALNNLSIYFRGKLELYKGKALIPLETELELVKAYLEIEQMRYGDRLNVDYDIDEDINVMIPPLTLQPLIENSIRHGLAKKNHGGNIKISVKSTSMDSVCIEVEDDGVGMSQEKQKELLEGKSQRLGFRNIVEKLKILKGSTISIESNENEGTRITITIPEAKSYESYSS